MKQFTLSFCLAILAINLAFAQAPPVAINELVASNDASAADEAGEFDDWIELFNNTNEAIDLTGYTMSDNPENLLKWEFPAGTVIAPSGYLIIWADEDGDLNQGPLHASFRLAAGGETLFLVDGNGDVVDRVEFSQQQPDVALARVPNGTGDFVLQAPTFNADNESSATVEFAEVNVSVYPNPASEVLTLEGNGAQDYPVALFEMSGRQVYEGNLRSLTRVDVSQLPAGNYLLRVGPAAQMISIR